MALQSNMLTVPLRTTEPVQLATAIRHSIEVSYDQHPDMFKDDVDEINKLRESAVVKDVHVATLKRLVRYFMQLTFMSSKFPADIGVNFTWVGTLGHTVSGAVKHKDVQFERANVLYNIGAMYSQLGFQENRTNSEGLKRACQHFQHASGAFLYLKDHVVPEMRTHPPDELAGPTLETLIALMLAQSQECFWQKAILDNLKNSLIARLAHQVSVYYDETLTAAYRSPVIRSEWIHHITCKKFHFEAAAQYRAASECLAIGKFGDEIGRLEAALEASNKAAVSSKYVAQPVQDDLKGLQEKLKSDLKRAIKDNDMIYNERVPAVSALPPLKKASMVTSAVPDEVAHAARVLHAGAGYGAPLFAKLVPFAAHQAASIYVDRKDTLVSGLVSSMEVLTVQLHDVLQTLNLPSALQALEKPVGLPAQLVAQAETVRAQGGADRLHAMIADVAKLAAADRALFRETADVLEGERREDDALRLRHGTSHWARPPSAEAAGDLAGQLDQYAKILQAAEDSDAKVRAKFAEHERLIALLGADSAQLERYLPQDARQSVLEGLRPEARAKVDALRELMNEVSRTEYRRRKFVEDLRAKSHDDEIEPAVLAETERLELEDPLRKIEAAAFEDIFKARLRAYDAERDRVDAEEQQQQKLVTDIEVANAAFVAVVHRDGDKSEREHALQELETAYFKFTELVNNLDEGRKFYNDFAGPLARMRDEAKDFVYSRRMEAHELEMDLTRDFGRLSVAPAPAAPGQAPPRPPRPPQEPQGRSNVWNPSSGIQFGR
ncbi:BRO1-like domain-containing protein [Dipodascopsis tothii]|uniref:BRO1-like domain-containing protein n=1 Tax=Dipodascopsis tothii TaxID=44089 RepID=UPI0034CDDE8C